MHMSCDVTAKAVKKYENSQTHSAGVDLTSQQITVPVDALCYEKFSYCVHHLAYPKPGLCNFSLISESTFKEQCTKNLCFPVLL